MKKRIALIVLTIAGVVAFHAPAAMAALQHSGRPGF
jgi:hypothetical protein